PRARRARRSTRGARHHLGRPRAPRHRRPRRRAGDPADARARRREGQGLVAPRRASVARRRVPHSHRSLAARRARGMTTSDAYFEYLRGIAPTNPTPRRPTMLHDAMTIFRYQMRLLLREPVWIIVVMIQPLLYLALFAPLLDGIAKTPGFPPGDAWQVFVPGLLIQLGIFGSMFVGFGIIAEIRFGTVERMRVTPASRLGLLLGRVLRDTVVLLLQAALLTLIAVAFG